MKHIPLKEFYERRLAKTKAMTPEKMGVASNKGRIGGYIAAGAYRKVKTFAEMRKRREKVSQLLRKYAA